MTDCGIYSDYDFYDYDKVEKLQKKRSLKWLKLYKKFIDAKKRGNKKALEKTEKTLMKHELEDWVLKGKSQETGYYWY